MGDGSHCIVDRATSNMQRSASAFEGSFWKTIELLAGHGRRRSAADVDDVATPTSATRTNSVNR